MQYTIYIVLGLCLACLAGSIALFFVYERRWQNNIEFDAEVIMKRGKYKAPVREDSVSPRQWQELRLRLGEMQIVAEESARPLPYENVA